MDQVFFCPEHLPGERTYGIDTFTFGFNHFRADVEVVENQELDSLAQ